MSVLILHYHEIWLKGYNRKFFISKLKEAVGYSLDGLPIRAVRHEENRILAWLDASGDENPQTITHEAVQRLRKVPGIAYLAIAQEFPPQLDQIVERGAELMLKASFHTFAVRAKRSRKDIPFRAADIHHQLGRRIEERAREAGRPVKVDLDHPDSTCHVEILNERALVYTEKIPGLGGLPTGTAGRLVCLLSGGFDSTVAAYKIMRRGVRLSFVHGATGRGQPADRSKVGPSVDTLPGQITALPGTLHRSTTAGRGVGASVLADSALSPDHAAHRRAYRPPHPFTRYCYRRQHRASRFPNSAEHGSRWRGRDDACLPAARWR